MVTSPSSPLSGLPPSGPQRTTRKPKCTDAGYGFTIQGQIVQYGSLESSGVTPVCGERWTIQSTAWPSTARPMPTA
jgi:hypothetical protein